MQGLSYALVILGFCLSTAFVVKENEQKSPICTNRLPMTNYFEHGYDLSEYDIFACPKIGGQKAKFVSINTCNKGEKFKLREKEYDVPDQFYRVYHTAFLHMTVGHSYSEFNDLKDEYVDSTVFENSYHSIRSIQKNYFKNSQFYKDMNSIFANKSRINLVYNHGTNYGMQMYARTYNKSHFTPEFVIDYNSLPEKFEGNEKYYVDFVSKYGTHMLVNANFGGVVYRYAKISNQDIYERKEDEISWNLRKDAFALNDSLDILCEKKDGIRQVLKVHAKNRDFYQVMVGGYADASLYSNTSIPVDAIKALPALVSSEVEPISNLFDDNENKKKNLEKAIKIYISKQYIKSRVARIQIYINSGRVLDNSTWFTMAEQSEIVYDEDQLNKIGNQLNTAVNVMKYKPITILH